MESMKQLTYKITQGYSESVVERQEVTGTFLFDLFGYQWAAHQEYLFNLPLGCWIVSEVSTGFELESGKFFKDIDEAKEWAWSYLIKKGEILTRYYVERARMKLQEYEQTADKAVR
jgi:hypothetical protein